MPSHGSQKKANRSCLRQLEFISQFSTQIVHISGSENLVADALSRLCQVIMPATLEAQELQDENDSELKDLLMKATLH
jgi:hypothetical protein